MIIIQNFYPIVTLYYLDIVLDNIPRFSYILKLSGFPNWSFKTSDQLEISSI